MNIIFYERTFDFYYIQLVVFAKQDVRHFVSY